MLVFMFLLSFIRTFEQELMFLNKVKNPFDDTLNAQKAVRAQSDEDIEYTMSVCRMEENG